MAKELTTAQVAQLLGVTQSRIRQLIISGDLVAEKIGRDHLITENAVIAYQNSPAKKCGRPKNS